MSSDPVDHLQSVKEVMRHALYLTGGTSLIRLIKSAKGLHTDHISEAALADRFSTIYEKDIWGGGGSRSGPGSNPESTSGLVAALSALLAELRVKRVTDIGCGDFGWMQHVSGDFQYVGVDIVAPLVADLNRKHRRPGRSFQHLDASRDPLPPGDLALCREVLFHLSFADAWRVIENCQQQGYTYLITTTDSQIWFNSEIASGDHRPLNLRKAPFGFPDPLRLLADDHHCRGRMLGLWVLADIQVPPRYRALSEATTERPFVQ
jgi:SAM-dependent methyltransferase